MTDAFTDELFDFNGAQRLVFPASRLLVDVERFADDGKEPMAAKGMGAVYTRDSRGCALKRLLSEDERTNLMKEYYEPHHKALAAAVDSELSRRSRALIVDCHSFPSRPLACDEDRSEPRPDFCVGTDEFHTPPGLSQAALTAIRGIGCSVLVNRPYAGTMVPASHYGNEPRVMSVMIEVNRSLYMDEKSGRKAPGFNAVRRALLRVLAAIGGFSPHP